MTVSRQPSGAPASSGGQFASRQQSTADVELEAEADADDGFDDGFDLEGRSNGDPCSNCGAAMWDFNDEVYTCSFCDQDDDDEFDDYEELT